MDGSAWKSMVVFSFMLGALTLSSSRDMEPGRLVGVRDIGKDGFILSSEQREDRLRTIRELGRVVVITRNHPQYLQTYQGEAMGFEYELMKAFADYLGVGLEMKTLGRGDMIQALNQGRGDFAAVGIVATPFRQRFVDFSDGFLSIQPRVVVRKDGPTITEFEGLTGKTIHVKKRSTHEERLHELREEGLDITVELHEGVSAEELIRRVARREIEMTMADSHIAFRNRLYYPNIKVGIPVGEPLSLVWAVKKGEGTLLNAINDFFNTIKTDGTFQRVYRAYYGNSEVFDRFEIDKFHERIRTRLPRYEESIKRSAKKYGFDWRLIAAVIYQESQFDPEARSHRGVRGLMQLTDLTAKEVGVTDRLDPEQSIMGGVKYLKNLYQRYDTAKGLDRILLTLASYNVGPRHISNAQRIARKKGLKPYKWLSLEQTLPLLCQEEYLKLNKFGYCRGTEPVRYVNRILVFFDILRRQAVGEPFREQLTRTGKNPPGLDMDRS